MLISIIIPIYKVEKYIRGTLDSIYNQECDENTFEVICVNDGTPDGSMDIVKDFQLTHNNLQVINQENQGLSCARNAGLKVAKGDYIWFVDSDDKLSIKGVNIVIKNIHKYKADIYGYDIKLINEKTKKEEIQSIICLNKNNIFYSCMCNGLDLCGKIQNAPVQRFIFKHTFLKQHNMEFYPGILHEDIEFMCKCLIFVKKMVIINEAPYSYLIRESGSIMSDLNTIKSFNSKLKIIKSFISLKTRKSLNKRQALWINYYILEMVLNILGLYKSSNEYNTLIYNNNKILKFWALKGLFTCILLNKYKMSLKALIAVTNFNLYFKLTRFMWK